MRAPWTPPQAYESRPIAILGAGVLGRRIATCWVSAGWTVKMRDPSVEQGEAAVKFVEENAPSYAEKTGRALGKAEAYEKLEDALEDAWLVIEAVPEKLPIKIDTFAELERLAPNDAILASNSSSYKSSEMLDKVSDDTKARILNTHYYMPPTAMAVELMTDGYTAEEIFPFLTERHSEAGLVPFTVAKESTGFIFNRLWAAIKREIMTIMDDGVATPETIDAMWATMFGTEKPPPCRLMDSVGLDTVAFIEEHYIKERGLSGEKTVDFLRKNYIDQGRLGSKCAKGGLHPPAPPAATTSSAAAKQTSGPRILALDIGLSSVTHPVKSAGSVLELSADGKITRVLAERQSLPDGIDISPEGDRIFWTCMGDPGVNDGAVYSAKPDGSDVKEIVPRGAVNTPKQLVVDPVNRKLYFCDREGMRVFRCGFDGSELENIVKNGDWEKDDEDVFKWCVGISVAPQMGKFFWTQKGPSKGNKGRIFSAGIAMPAGQTAETRSDIEVVVDALPEPIDLELDEKSLTLYWTDRGELPSGNTLNKVALTAEGKAAGKHAILAKNFNEAIGLKIDHANGHIYVADLGGSVYRCKMDGSEKTRLFLDDERAITGVALLF
ncbi:uncharacterized protein K452DRAFT_234539 [Aplosporella prunicola CBS 121167]|uniref:Uncharacterized protein n=1 Tax=Aplosporella prunicola CBS 121167 TaxID=1176127 RepID=A0A6A6B4Q2_9PEZI|nr:uncharacterized protein K452DRAFT_234539 [Aplosporella prunicola CBS 121167]KAF2138383.1 hypothetical protein K452DRAFT_234539 [Aplosporella prunicola CBS 121167]